MAGARLHMGTATNFSERLRRTELGAKGMPGYVELNPLMPAKLAHHDLLRNLRLAKKLYALAQVETDSRLAEILAMDDDSFVSALQTRWHGSSP